MPQFNSCLLAAISSLLLATLACAQDTNAPRTRLEAFEGQTDILIVRGAALVGDVHAGAGLVCHSQPGPGIQTPYPVMLSL